MVWRIFNEEKVKKTTGLGVKIFWEIIEKKDDTTGFQRQKG